MSKTSVLLLLVVIMITTIVLSDNNGNKKWKKKYIGKAKFNGIYDESKYNEPLFELINEKENKEEETKEKLLNKININEIDIDGNEYEYEILDNDIDEIIKKGKILNKESSNNGNNNNNENNESKESKSESESEINRRLAILGEDTRIEIEDSSSSPFKFIGLLEFESDDKTWFCSATLIGPDIILTAAHCVNEGGNDGDSGNNYDNFKFYPGRTRDKKTLTGDTYGWRKIFTFSAWKQDSTLAYDIALIKLDENVYDSKWLSFGYNNNINKEYKLLIHGYPGDKEYGSMWKTKDYVYYSYTEILYTDDSDTYGGMSGSSCYFNEYNIIYAVHSGSSTFTNGDTYNRHPRITSTKYNAMCEWINNNDVC